MCIHRGVRVTGGHVLSMRMRVCVWGVEQVGMPSVTASECRRIPIPATPRWHGKLTAPLPPSTPQGTNVWDLVDLPSPPYGPGPGGRPSKMMHGPVSFALVKGIHPERKERNVQVHEEDGDEWIKLGLSAEGGGVVERGAMRSKPVMHQAGDLVVPHLVLPTGTTAVTELMAQLLVQVSVCV